MNYQTIAEVYETNDRVRASFKETVAGLDDVQLGALPADEKWTLRQLIEHVSIVDEGMTRICAKLLGKAEAAGKAADGSVKISDAFLSKGAEVADRKVEAPDFVQPVNGLSVAESLAKLDGNEEALNALREKFEKFECSGFTFTHPFFGDLSAHEWLVLRGAHEARHLKQMKKLIEKIGSAEPPAVAGG